MSPALVYWLAIAGIGLAAAVGSFVIGLRFLKKLQLERRAHYWPETVRDTLLVIGLGFNLLVGILAASHAHDGMALIAILGGATCLSLFAVFNFVLRIP